MKRLTIDIKEIQCAQNRVLEETIYTNKQK